MGAQTEWSRGLGLCHRAAMAMETQIHFLALWFQTSVFLGLCISFLRP